MSAIIFLALIFYFCWNLQTLQQDKEGKRGGEGEIGDCWDHKQTHKNDAMQDGSCKMKQNLVLPTHTSLRKYLMPIRFKQYNQLVLHLPVFQIVFHI